MSDEWHDDFPHDAQEMWDVMAKALLLRLGGAVLITQDEQRIAARAPALMCINGDGSVKFCMERSASVAN